MPVQHANYLHYIMIHLQMMKVGTRTAQDNVDETNENTS